MKAKTFTVPFGSSGFNSVADLAECLANQTDPVGPPPSTPRQREIAWIACVAQLDEGPRAFLVRPKPGVTWHELADAHPQNWDATALTDQETLCHGLDGYVAQVLDSSPEVLASIPRMANGWFRSTYWNAVSPWDDYGARETLNGLKRLEWADRLWDSIEDGSLPAMRESGESWRHKDQCDGDATFVHIEHLKHWFSKHEPFIELEQGDASPVEVAQAVVDVGRPGFPPSDDSPSVAESAGLPELGEAEKRLPDEAEAWVRKATASSGGKKRSEPYIEPKRFVQSEWIKHRSDYENNKSDFARTYVRLVKQRFDLEITERTVYESWLKDIQ